MRKLLTLFTATALITATTTSAVACSTTPQGNPVSVFVYNGNQKFAYNPTANGNTVNGIDDATKSGKDETGAPYEYSIQGGKMGLVSNAIIPFLTGLNLTEDNNASGKGAKWTSEQIGWGLKGQKDSIISNASSSGIDPFSGKTIDQKALWTSFFDDYSTSYDSYYTQVSILASENNTILASNNNVVTMTGNVEKAADKDWVKTVPGENYVQTPDSLKVISPVASIINWLNTPTNGYTAGINEINANRGYQSARYIAINIPNVTIRIEFQGEKNRYTFSATIKELTAYANYLVYQDPNSSNDAKKYAHQWFFLSYGFYNFLNLPNDEYHDYSFETTINKNSSVVPAGTKVALGYVKSNDPIGTLTEEEDKSVGDNGKFVPTKSDYTFPDLEWTINVQSITNEY